jgi:hypothetical protein
MLGRHSGGLFTKRNGTSAGVLAQAFDRTTFRRTCSLGVNSWHGIRNSSIRSRYPRASRWSRFVAPRFHHPPGRHDLRSSQLSLGYPSCRGSVFGSRLSDRKQIGDGERSFCHWSQQWCFGGDHDFGLGRNPRSSASFCWSLCAFARV